MGEVLDFHTADDVAREDTVALLEEILVRAKAGEIVCFGLSAVLRSGHTASYASPSVNLSSLIGGLVILQAELASHAISTGQTIPEGAL